MFEAMYTVKVQRRTPDGHSTSLAETNGDYAVHYGADGVRLILQPTGKQIVLMDGDVAYVIRSDRTTVDTIHGKARLTAPLEESRAAS